MIDKELLLQHGARTAFDIGWDFARLGIELRGFFSTDGVFKPVRDGYQEGVSKYGHRRPQYPNGTQRFVIKWLHLRMNAYKRGRTFSAGLTWEYLQSIDDTHCPVTRMPFTYGEGLDSDWTIDRINNNGGYSEGNVIGLSRLANYAKGTMKARSCVTASMRAAQADDKLHRGLTEAQWMRLSSLVSPNESNTNPEVGFLPMACLPKIGILTTLPLQQLQLYSIDCFTQHKSGKLSVQWVDAFKALDRHNAFKKARSFADYAYGATQMARKGAESVRWAVEDAWLCPTVIGAWLSLVESITVDEIASVLAEYERLTGRKAKPLKATYAKEWHLETKGYAIPGVSM